MASARRERGKKTWEVVWDEPRDPETGKRRQRSKRGFPTKRAALQWYSDMAALERQRGMQPTGAETIGGYVALFLSRHPVSESSLYAYESRARLYIYPHLGSIPLHDLGPEHVHVWLKALENDGLATGTIAKSHNLLSTVLEDAVSRGILTVNVCKLAKAPQIQTRQFNVWNEQQIRQFLQVADQDKLGLLYRVMLFSQMRPGEVVALKWGDVDWKRGVVTVERTRKRKTDGGFRVGDSAKTPAGRRSIPLSDDLMTRLARHREQQEEKRFLMRELWQEHDLIFCRDNGTMLSDNSVNKRLTAIAKEAGIPRLRPHELRHSGATLLFVTGEHLKVISERLGHRSVSTTADRYLWVSEQMQRDVSDRLARIIEDQENEADRLIESTWQHIEKSPPDVS